MNGESLVKAECFFRSDSLFIASSIVVPSHCGPFQFIFQFYENNHVGTYWKANSRGHRLETLYDFLSVCVCAHACVHAPHAGCFRAFVQTQVSNPRQSEAWVVPIGSRTAGWRRGSVVSWLRSERSLSAPWVSCCCCSCLKKYEGFWYWSNFQSWSFWVFCKKT